MTLSTWTVIGAIVAIYAGTFLFMWIVVDGAVPILSTLIHGMPVQQAEEE